MREKHPDKKKAVSIIVDAEIDLQVTLEMPLTGEMAAIITRNVYECFRMRGMLCL